MRRRCQDPGSLIGPVPGIRFGWIPPQTVPLKKGHEPNTRLARRALPSRQTRTLRTSPKAYGSLPNPPDATDSPGSQVASLARRSPTFKPSAAPVWAAWRA